MIYLALRTKRHPFSYSFFFMGEGRVSHIHTDFSVAGDDLELLPLLLPLSGVDTMDPNHHTAIETSHVTVVLKHTSVEILKAIPCIWS